MRWVSLGATRNRHRECDTLGQDSTVTTTDVLQPLRRVRLLGGALDLRELVERQMLVVTGDGNDSKVLRSGDGPTKRLRLRL